MKFLHKAFLMLFALNIAVAAFAPGSGEAASASVELLSNADVDGPYVELGEIAFIAAPTDILEAISAIRVGIVPPFGVVMNLRKSDIEARLLRERSIAANFIVGGPQSVAIKRAGEIITYDLLQNTLETFIREKFDGRVKVKWKESATEFTVNRGDVLIEVKTPSHKSSALPQSIAVYVDGKLVKLLSLSRYVEFITPVAIAREAIARGSAVPESSVFVEIRTVPPGKAVIMDIADCTGFEAIRTIGAGEEISPDSIRKPYDVKRGDAVSVMIEMDGITIEAQASASQDGYVGDVIAVRLDEGGKVMRGVITSPTSVILALKR